MFILKSCVSLKPCLVCIYSSPPLVLELREFRPERECQITLAQWFHFFFFLWKNRDPEKVEDLSKFSTIRNGQWDVIEKAQAPFEAWLVPQEWWALALIWGLGGSLWEWNKAVNSPGTWPTCNRQFPTVVLFLAYCSYRGYIFHSPLHISELLIPLNNAHSWFWTFCLSYLHG